MSSTELYSIIERRISRYTVPRLIDIESITALRGNEALRDGKGLRRTQNAPNPSYKEDNLRKSFTLTES